MKNYRTVSWVEYQSRPKDMDFVEFMDKLEKKHKLEAQIQQAKDNLEGAGYEEQRKLLRNIEVMENSIIRLGI